MANYKLIKASKGVAVKNGELSHYVFPVGFSLTGTEAARPNWNRKNPTFLIASNGYGFPKGTYEITSSAEGDIKGKTDAQIKTESKEKQSRGVKTLIIIAVGSLALFLMYKLTKPKQA
jgi:hypothetical protein